MVSLDGVVNLLQHTRNPSSGTNSQFRWTGLGFQTLEFEHLSTENDLLVRSIINGTRIEVGSGNIFTTTGFSVVGTVLRFTGSFVGGANPSYTNGQNYRLRFSQARVGGQGPVGATGPKGDQGDVSTVLGEGDGMVRTSLTAAEGLGTGPDDVFQAGVWTVIGSQQVSAWDTYDWIEFYAYQSGDTWSGRIRIDEDAITRLRATDISATINTSSGATGHPAFESFRRNRLVFAASNVSTNTQVYIGSPDVILASNFIISIWGLTEGVVESSSHRLTEAEVTNSASTAFGLISGQRIAQSVTANLPTVPQDEAEAGTASTRRTWTSQRVRQSTEVAINERILHVDHAPPAASAENEDSLIVVGTTGDVYAQRQETHHSVDSTATWENAILPFYLGAFYVPPAPATNFTYYDIGLRDWRRTINYAGTLRWSSGGEPDAWRGYAASEADAARNNIDAIGQICYVANQYRLRRSVTFTEGTGPSVQRTWENQRESEFQGTATATMSFYDAGEIAVVVTSVTGVTDDFTRAYICLRAGDYDETSIPDSDNWLRVSPSIRVPVPTDEATQPDFVKRWTADASTNAVPANHTWIDTGFDFDTAAQNADQLEFSIEACLVEFNRRVHPSEIERLNSEAVNAFRSETTDPTIPRGITFAGSAAASTQGSDCRIWLGKDVNNNILFAIRGSAENDTEMSMWRIE